MTARNATLEDLAASRWADVGGIAPKMEPFALPVCTCRGLILPGADACPEHVGFTAEDGTFMRRCGDSDATGNPYFVGGPALAVTL